MASVRSSHCDGVSIDNEYRTHGKKFDFRIPIHKYNVPTVSVQPPTYLTRTSLHYQHPSSLQTNGIEHELSVHGCFALDHAPPTSSSDISVKCYPRLSRDSCTDSTDDRAPPLNSSDNCISPGLLHRLSPRFSLTTQGTTLYYTRDYHSRSHRTYNAHNCPHHEIFFSDHEW